MDCNKIDPSEPSNAGGSAPYFNLVSSNYFSRYEENTPGGYAFRVRKERLLELLDASSERVQGRRVLDVGCGPGLLVPDLLSRGFDFWGVDAAPNMIKECQANFGNLPAAHFSVGDAVHLDFPEGSFDMVICAGVIDHIRDYRQAIAEMLRVLRVGGILLVAFPNVVSPVAWWRNHAFYPAVRALRPLYFGLIGRPQPPALSSVATLHSRKSAEDLIQESGGEVNTVVYYNFNPAISPLDEIFPRLTVWASERFERFRTGSLRWLGCGFLVKGRKRW